MRIKMRKNAWLIFLFSYMAIHAQSAEDTLRAYAFEGIQTYKKEDYALAEKYFRKALQYGQNDTVMYDLAASLYKQNRKNEALDYFQNLARTSQNDSIKADAWHNAGNIYYEKKQYEKAVEAYKNALRLRPDDNETRYNYALAKEKLKKQQNKNKNNKQNKQNKNQSNKNKQNKDKQNQNKNKNKRNNQNQSNKKKNNNKNQDNQSNKDNNKNKEDKQKNNQNNKDQNKNNQRGNNRQPDHSKDGTGKRKSKLSPEETRRILQALKNKENQTLKKVKLRKARPAVRHKNDKDW